MTDVVAPPVKTIFVYINGIEHADPQKALLDARKFKNWSRILQEITRAIKCQIIVKKMFTLEGKIVRDFSELISFQNYVVSDHRDYIRVEKGYLDQRGKVKYLNPYSNCALWLKNLQKNLTHVRPDLLTIYVYKNNMPDEDARKFVLTQQDIMNWTNVLNFIARCLDYPSETIKYLYTTNGEKICGAWELQHGAFYVAMGLDEKFIPGPYKESLSSSSRKWKYGIPYVYKPKLEFCVHRKPNIKVNSWEQKINWKHFNLRYADFLEDCYTCNKNTPCRPMCDCVIHNTESRTSGWESETNVFSETETDYSTQSLRVQFKKPLTTDFSDESIVDSLKRSNIRVYRRVGTGFRLKV